MTAPAPLSRRRGRIAPDDPSRAGDTGYQVGRMQDAATTATNAAAADAREMLAKDVGARLGGLAGIGALRSGGAAVGVREATKDFGDRVGRAASANALQAAALGQAAAAGVRDLQFREREGAANRSLTASEGAAERGSREKIAGDDLGFRREQEAGINTRFGQELTSREREGLAERASREGISRSQLESGERVAGLDRTSREKLAADELGFRTTELGEKTRQFDADLGFRREDSTLTRAEQGRQFDADLGFRREDSTTRNSIERERIAAEDRRFNLERQDKLKEAERKKKGGLFGFVGKALGFAADFIPAPGFVKNLAKNSIGSALRSR